MSPLGITVRRTSCLIILGLAAAFPGEIRGRGPDQDRVDRGRELFFREWVPGDPRSHGGDGLGPLYNETSCVACHNLGGPGGAGPSSKNVDIVTLFRGGRLIEKAKIDEYHPGFHVSPSVLLHRFGTDPEYRLWRLRRVAGVEFADMAERGGQAEIEQVRELMDLKPDTRARQLSRPRASAAGCARERPGLPRRGRDLDAT